MRRSLRWKLLGYYTVILLLVIGSMGSASYLRQKDIAYLELQGDLETYSAAVLVAIEWDEDDGFEFELSDRYRARLDPGYPDFYFVVWGPEEETILVRSRNLPSDLPKPSERRVMEGRWMSHTFGPGDTTIEVGRGTADIESDLRALKWSVVRTCLFALGVALVGGLTLGRHLLSPIERISEAASRISASNLSERIDVGRTESELGHLAGVLNEAFDRLQAAVERQARFTADASHELRTPLAVVRANAEWGLRADRPVEEYRETLESVLDASLRMESLVERLLKLARGDGTGQPRAMDPVDLAVLAQDTAAFLQPVAQEHAVAQRVTGAPARTRGDPARLREALASLVTNAIEHGGSGGIVTLTTGVEDGTAFVSVADHGPGIPSADLPHVFARFFRVDASRSANTGGRGLGLAIAQQIVEAHGGTINVKSDLTEGATFTIRLPVADPD